MDFVEAHNTQASSQQKQYFDKHTKPKSFAAGDSVWLSIPTVGKLDLKADGLYRALPHTLYMIVVEQEQYKSTG